MRYGSVCSGIEAASVAWEPLGMTPSWFSEIEAFPSAVLAHHWPSVANLGDMTKISRRVLLGEIEAPDVLVGGTPCQAFSVAGMREGMADVRGQLTMKYVELANAIDAVRVRAGNPETVIVWENVPGVLSDKQNAFGCFLGALAGEDRELQPSGKKWTNAGCVYGPQRAVAWRVLDAQYFGVAQRRRRVFVVASARTDIDPAEILFERDSLRRDTPPSREAEKDAAGTFKACASSGGWSNSVDHAAAGYMQPGNTYQNVSHCLNAGGMGRIDHETESFVVHGTQDPCTGSQAFALGRNNGAENAVYERLRGREGGATAELGGPIAGTLRASSGGGDKPYIMFDTCYTKGITHKDEANHASAQKTDPTEALRILRKEAGEEVFAKWGLGILNSLQSPEVLQQALHGVCVRPAAFSRSWVVYCALSRKEDGSAWLLQSLREAGCIGCSPQGQESLKQLDGELRAYLSELSQPGAQSERFMLNLWEASEGAWILRKALSAIQEVGRPLRSQKQSAHETPKVRKLIPEECEFLQGFPRNHTHVPYRNKPATDGPRYKAIGNSMAVPCMAWIGSRLTALMGVASCS